LDAGAILAGPFKRYPFQLICDQSVSFEILSGGDSVREEKSMTIRKIEVERFSITSSHPFDAVMAKLEAAVGHPDMQAFRRDTSAAETLADLEGVVGAAISPAGLMEFARFDLGEILRKQHGAKAPRSMRLVMGNPLIMKEMVIHVPDAGSYAPVTVLVDERPDGVHLSYDRMASFLAPYGSPEALQVARDLDAKVEALLTAAA
jgi:uncharacterized protein (DUF302 family)